jgi:magnesium transporter
LNEEDLPKVDDFGHHLVFVLHGLRNDRIDTYELDCFLTDDALVTIHQPPSPAADALWETMRTHPELASGGVSELAARLADGLCRRLLSVVDAFDLRVEQLMAEALAADPGLLNDFAAVRADVAAVRRVVHPQQEALDVLRSCPSVLVSGQARRRFSDVFDVAARVTSGLDSARSALADTLDAYRGAEAREATEVTKVLTVYAALMLPLSLIAGFFGMNHENLPTVGRSWGWIVVTGLMAAVAILSFGVFVAEGWVRRPSGRRAGATLGRGLLEAARAPVHVAGAVFEISAMPLRTARAHLPDLAVPRSSGDSDPPEP